MVRGKNRIPYRVEQRLTGFTGPEYDARISLGLPLGYPFEPEDSQYRKSWLSLSSGTPANPVEMAAQIGGHLRVK